MSHSFIPSRGNLLAAAASILMAGAVGCSSEHNAGVPANTIALPPLGAQSGLDEIAVDCAGDGGRSAGGQ